MQQHIRQQYGSRRGLLHHVQHRLLDAFGHYHAFSEIDWTAVERLVFVCQGNICRSAYAEYYARRSGLDVASCGVNTRGGDAANERAIWVASARDIDLTSHRTSRLQEMSLKPGDLLLGMEPAHLEMAKQHLIPGVQLTLLGLWSEPLRPYIHDPYSSTDEYFDHCFDIIDSAIDAIAIKLGTATGPAA